VHTHGKTRGIAKVKDTHISRTPIENDMLIKKQLESELNKQEKYIFGTRRDV
jgi:hypothetical protein